MTVGAFSELSIFRVPRALREQRLGGLCLTLLATLLPAAAHPQESATTARVPGANLRGTVRDSLPRFGLTVTADSVGQYTPGDVPMGRYVLGFFHPVPDSLGIEPTLRHCLRETSDLFRNLPGVGIVRDSDGFNTVMVRGATEGWCEPTLYVDGMAVENWRTADVNDWIRPDHIAGMEIYSGSTAPPQFQVAFKSCGSILIWKK